MSAESEIDDVLSAIAESETETPATPPKAGKVVGQKAPVSTPDVVDVDMESPPSAPTSQKSSTPPPTSAQEAKIKMLSTLPVHAVGGQKSGKGRPRAVGKAPSVVDLQYHAEMAAQKIDFIENDPVVQSTTRRSDPISTLRTIKTEIAKEAAALHFQRIENEKYGKDTSQISVRRVDALSKVVAVELELKKMDGDFLDLKSEKFQAIFKFWIQTLQEVAQDTLTPELIDLFFNRLGTKLDGWEERAAEAAKES